MRQAAISPRMALCLRYYMQPYPRPANSAGDGWGVATLDEAIDRDFLCLGAHGAHDITYLGREALKNVQT